MVENESQATSCTGSNFLPKWSSVFGKIAAAGVKLITEVPYGGAIITEVPYGRPIITWF